MAIYGDGPFAELWEADVSHSGTGECHDVSAISDDGAPFSAVCLPGKIEGG